MSDTIFITDPELGEVNIKDTTGLVEAINEIPSEETTKNANKNIGNEDIEAYRTAWENADVEAMESLRAKHPEDARFNLHLMVAGISADEAQDFTELNKAHKALVKELGLDGVAEFITYLEQGKATKIKELASRLPKNSQVRKDIETLLPYLK